MDFSNYPFNTDVPYITKYLRKNKTIQQVFLDNCGIYHKQIKISAEVFRLNKTKTKLSFVNNKAIFDINLKPYQVTDTVESNKKNNIKKHNSKSELDWFRAIKEYISALEIRKDFNFPLWP